MKKTKLLLPLLMAIVMMAMSPTKVWADGITFTATAGTGSYTNAVDGTTTTDWYNNSDITPNGIYIEFYASEAMYVTGYTLTTGANAYSYIKRAPKNWVLKAKVNSTDTEWTTLDTKENYTSWTKWKYTPHKFTLPSKTAKAYKYFRLEVMHNEFEFELSEISISGTSTPCEHTNSLIHHDRVDPTCATGNIEYWSCPNCTQLFKGATASDENKIDNIVIAATDSHSFNSEHVCTTCGKQDPEYFTYTFRSPTTGTAKNAFDGDVSTIWIQSGNKSSYNPFRSYTSPVFYTSSPLYVTGYTFTTSDQCTAKNPDITPKKWVLKGRNIFDTEWTVIDTQENALMPLSAKSARDFTLPQATATAYQYFRLEIYYNENMYFELSEFFLLGTVNPCTHTKALTHHVSKAAACSVIGNSEHWTCPDCGQYFSSATASEATRVSATSVLIPTNNNHNNLTHHDAVAATCAATGNIEYWTCNDCGQYFKSATPNEESKIIAGTEQTATTTGVHSISEGTCTVCGATETASTTAKVVFNSSNKTLTFYYDNLDHSSQGTVYELNTDVDDPSWQSKSNITKVIFDASFANARPLSCYHWFYGLTNLTNIIGISNLNTSEVTNMQAMFNKCASLTTLDLSGFNTEKVTSMNAMFSACNSLISLDISNFNTKQVEAVREMFENCWSLSTLRLGSNFTAGKSEMLQNMFYRCQSLTSLDLSNFTTDNVTTMFGVFNGCYKLTSLNLEKFNTSKVTNMSSLFCNCQKLSSLTIGNFDMQNVTAVDGSLASVPHLQTLTIKALPYLMEEYKNVLTDAGTTVTYDLQLNDNSIVYSGENHLPAATAWTAAPTYTREMSNEWGTIVVPFAITYSQSNGNYKLYKLSATSASTLTFTEYDNEATIPAGTPMVIKAVGTKTADKYTVTLTANGNAVNKTITPTAAVGGLTMKGTYAALTEKTGIYFIAQGKFWSADAAITIAPFRAWFEGTLPSSVKEFNIVIDDEATGVSNVQFDNLQFTNGKFIENGRIVIVKNGKKYNANGQRIK